MQLPPGVVRQARVVDLPDGGVSRQERRQGSGVLLGARHPDGQRLDPPQEEPAVERRGDRPDRLLGEGDLFPDRRVRRDDRPADQVVVPSQELGGAVDDHVDPQVERPLEQGGHERVVHDGQDPFLPADPRGPLQVGDLHQGVRRRLDEQRLRLPADLFPHGGRVPHVHVVEGEAVGAQELLEQAVRPAVEIVRTEDVVPRPEEGHQGGDRRHPGGEGDGAGSPFEIRQRLLRRLARRVLSPRVVESLVLPEALVPVDGGRVDRDADGAVRLVRPHPRLRGDRLDLAVLFQGDPRLRFRDATSPLRRFFPLPEGRSYLPATRSSRGAPRSSGRRSRSSTPPPSGGR